MTLMSSIRKIPNLGKGKNMSIAKAALKVYYEYDNDYYKQEGHSIDDRFLDYGELDVMHEIVTIAGANHCSFFTARQVMSCLRNSPLWNCEFCPGFYKGMRGHGGATLAKPSEKGKAYYNNHLLTK